MSEPPSPSQPESASSSSRAEHEWIVVGIGASAGGLDAISDLVSHLPRAPDLALIVVQHLDPSHASILVDLLQRVTPLPVRWAQHEAEIQPGHIYVAPPGRSLTIRDGRLALTDSARRHIDGIDLLLRSLAEELAHRAVAVILSGNGGDGALGARAVKGAGGIVFVQEPTSAPFPSMPRSALETGCVDRALSPSEIAAELGRLTQQSHAAWAQLAPIAEEQGDARQLAAILRLIAARTGVDYSVYKPNTIRRRLARRMMIVKAASPGDYLKLLQRNREEVDALHESMLINVTEFFRDPDYFEFLRQHVLPEIFQRHADGSPIRLWVPGCATGEEAYSYGILLRELMENEGRIVPVQIFGTDVSDSAIARARSGVFPAGELESVDPERVRRFFHQTERGYLVHKPIRDMCIFARQNVFKDAPFSRLDLLSCRNLLIYLTAGMQQKLMPMFHYALNARGVLVLGHSESVSSHTELFRPLDPRFRIYTRRAATRPAPMEFPVDHPPATAELKPAKPVPPMPDTTKDSFDAIREADRIVATRRGPPGLLINDELDIVQFRGDVMPFLAPITGRATLKLLDMAREGLAIELQVAISQARERNVRMQRTGLSMMQGNTARQIAVDITPFSSLQTHERFFLLEFIAEPPPAAAAQPAEGSTEAAYLAQIAQLRQDLEATRNYLQSTIEQHETTNQELRAANEEIQSSNEELQSTNEELETAKEELQSTNEELSTVNDELHHRHVELVQANNDLTNLIGSVNLPILILGQDLTIRRFTPAAEKLFNLIPTDVGRPLSDINTNLEMKDLARRVAETVDSLTASECEVKDNKGRTHAMRLRPYKTAENKIEGVVLTLIDIDEVKRTIAAIEASRDFERAVFETAREPLAALTPDLRVRAASRAFYRLFGLQRAEPAAAADSPVFSELKKVLAGVLPSAPTLSDYELELHLAGGARGRFLVNACQVVGEQPEPITVLSLHAVG